MKKYIYTKTIEKVKKKKKREKNSKKNRDRISGIFQSESRAQSEGPFKAQCPEPTGWESLTSLPVTGDRRWKFPTA